MKKLMLPIGMLFFATSAWAACTPEDAAYCQTWSLKYGSLPCPLACTAPPAPPPTMIVCQPLEPGYCVRYGVSPCSVCTQVPVPPPSVPTPPPPVK